MALTSAGCTYVQFINGSEGWMGKYGPDNLLALRLYPVDPSVFTYTSDVPVFASGIEACAHGLRNIDEPSPEALLKIEGLKKFKGITE